MMLTSITKSGYTGYFATFNATTDWGSASGGLYSLAFTHNLNSAKVIPAIWDTTGAAALTLVNSVVQTSVNVLTITVISSPDNRFAGSIVIQSNASTVGYSGFSDPRETTITTGSAPTPNLDTTDIYTVTALAENPTFGAPEGTLVQGKPLIIRIKDNGTARTLAWNAFYRASSDLALPIITVINKTLYCGFLQNKTDSKLDFLGIMNNI